MRVEMTQEVTVQLLGAPEARLESRAVAFAADMRYQCLAYVAAAGDWVRRDDLVYMFWPDTPQDEARKHLRQLLKRIRKLEWLTGFESDAKRVRWPVATDVAQFREAVRCSDWSQAIAHYRGAFLADLDKGPAEFSSWLEGERGDLQRAWRDALMAGCPELLKARPAEVLEALERFSLEQTLDEEVLRLHLRCLAEAGKMGELGRVYDAFAARLYAEVEAAPAAETQTLYRVLNESAPRGEGGAGPQALNVFPTLVKSVFVGREQALKKLGDALTVALGGHGRAVVVEGEAGVGKTRLVEEFLLPLSGLQLFSGRCFERELSAPLEPVSAALSSLGGAARPASANEVRPWSDDPFVRSSVHKALTAQLVQAARLVRGTVLWIDDLQWADAATLEFLSYAAKRVQGEAVLIVLTYRREHHSELRDWLAHLAERRALTTLSLGRLEAKDTQRLLRDLACADFTELAWLADFVHQETEGNPFFVMEYLRWLYDTAVLELDEAQLICTLDRAAMPTAQLPDGIRTLILARYHSLPTSTRELLDITAVIGRRFEFGLLEAACAQTASELWARFAPLLGMGLVVEEPADHYAFSHDKLRQTIYNNLSPPLRRSLHAQLAAMLQNRQPDPAELAHHYLRAHLWTQAFAALMAAATEAVKVTNAWESALQALARAADILDYLPDADRKRFEVLKLRERLYEYLNRLSERAATVERMIALAERLGDPHLAAEAQVKRMSVLMDYGDKAGALEAQSLAVKSFNALGDRAALADIYREIGYFAWKNSDYQGVLEAGATALELYRQLGNRHAEATITGNIAQAYKYLGRHQDALAWADKAATLYQTLGNRLGLYFKLDILAWIHEQRGELSAAKALLEQLITLCEGMGDKHLQVEKNVRLGRICRELLEPRLALDYFKAAAGLGADTGDARHEAYPLLYVAATQEHLADYEAAAHTYEQVARLLETAYAITGAASELIGQADALTQWGGVLHRALGRFDEALGCYNRAATLYGRQGPGQSLSKLLLARAALQWQRGYLEASQQDFSSAHDLAAELGDAPRQTVALASLGVVYRDLGRLEDSIEASLNALAQVTKLGDLTAEARILLSLADSYRACGHTAEAGRCLERSLALRDKLGDVAGKKVVERELASLRHSAAD